LNPTPREHWAYHGSVAVMAELLGERMYPLTLAGIDQAMRVLLRPASRQA
jgi:hypothetical protein